MVKLEEVTKLQAELKEIEVIAERLIKISEKLFEQQKQILQSFNEAVEMIVQREKKLLVIVKNDKRVWNEF